MTKTLEIQNLSIGYPGKKGKPLQVAQNLNFYLKKGEFVAIVGANGIGKSTLLRTLAGVQEKLSGEVLIDGQRMESIPTQQLAASLSIVLTEPLATKNLTVSELISLGRQPYTNWLGSLTENDKKAIHNAIRTIGLESLEHRKCYELSDGQLQKVLIARALAQDTPIMMLDEPTTHLDLYHKVQVLKTMKQIAREFDKTVIYTTHEIDLAIQLCDKMLILDSSDYFFGSPCEHIENKNFQNLFPSDLIHFDPGTGTFKIKN
ncbi:ABC transporter ATP-binding protein [Muriicola sp. E247]|uniref:ABC transporter ATP-binding protein n=1 Tax=Muriicola sp. E247 TaxID=3242730 RepID=UPI003526602C